MLLFTKKQLEQIREYLAAYGIRTTDFPDAPTITADDWVAIVQGGVNKKVKISDLFDPDLLPSLIVDINVKDDWAEITDDDHDSALSARLGKELKDMIVPTVVVNSWSDPNITRGDYALSASLGYDLYNRFQDIAEPIDNLGVTSTSGLPLDAHQGYVLAQMIGDKANKTEVYTKSQVYTKEEVDALIQGGGGGGTTTALAELTDDVDVVTTPPTNGKVLMFNGTKWVPGEVASTDTWRPISVKGSAVTADDTLNIAEGSNVSLSLTRSGSVSTLTISATGGGQGGGGDYYIGNTKAHPSTAEPYQMLAGLGSVEILGMSSSSGSKRIYFGSSEDLTSPYIEILTDNGTQYFHFSHGIASDSFVCASGYNNNEGGGGSGASYLYDLTDVKKVGSSVSRADGATAAQNNDVLTYSSALGKWVAAPAQGGGTGGSTVEWGSVGADNVTLTVDGVSKTLLTAHQDLSGYQTKLDDSSNKLPWSYITGFPNKTLYTKKGNTTTKTYTPGGSSNVTITISDLADSLKNPYSLTFTKGNKSYDGSAAVSVTASDIMNSLTLGTKGTPKTYNGVSDVTFGIDDLTNNVIGTADGSYVQIGAIKIQYVASSNCLKVIGASGSSANFFATGGITAGVTN